MTRQPLTDRQLEVYVYLKDYFRKNDMLPATRTIAEHFKQTSQSSAIAFQRALEAKGYIEKNAAGRYRFARGGK